MSNPVSTHLISNQIITDYIFDQLPSDQRESIEDSLMSDESIFHTIVELMLLVIKKGFSQSDLLIFMDRNTTVDFKF